MELNLTQIGNSVGVILPKELLAEMNISKGDKIYWTRAADGDYRISPYNPDFALRMEAAREIMRKRRNVLRELAK
ncbi:MAG: AbrB/MazE/SpoVT family DNA-binding domain-containing protein [Alphaproteobacteria bacterium]|jgi:putative addiction module antidote|nr:AbrB/MazE/SpoVT family DNA-binding domain-containing protein [Thalassospira sp.]MCE2964243.1 AbrB/MazE/SpoVT family DNA-binding domain-containing protein [Alphaproteobacteria bacterium]